MADGSVHVLNDLLCFVSCKYGRLPTKQLKSVLIDFYNEDVISKAKVCLLNDIMKIDSSVSFRMPPVKVKAAVAAAAAISLGHATCCRQSCADPADPRRRPQADAVADPLSVRDSLSDPVYTHWPPAAAPCVQSI